MKPNPTQPTPPPLAEREEGESQDKLQDNVRLTPRTVRLGARTGIQDNSQGRSDSSQTQVRLRSRTSIPRTGAKHGRDRKRQPQDKVRLRSDSRRGQV